MRLVFAGTPAAAVPALRLLLDSPRHDVVAVITRPAARAGRGRKVAVSPVAELAGAADVEVLTPEHPGDDDFLARLAQLAPECCPVVAYGALLPARALAVPTRGWVNLHFSLLPAWRGAAPVPAAIRHGDDVTGASTFLIEAGLDTGPVYGVLTETIRLGDTAGELLDRLSVEGAKLLLATMDGIEDGTLIARPQSSDDVSIAGKLTAIDARVDWARPALGIDRAIRSCTPAPGAWTLFRGARVKLGPLVAAPRSTAPQPDPARAPELALAPGVVQQRGVGVWVGTGSHPVELGWVQPPGGRMMPAADWARGARPVAGERFDAQPIANQSASTESASTEAARAESAARG